MPISDQDILLIQSYLQGRLTNEEQDLFDIKSKDSEFIAEIETQTEVRDLIYSEGRRQAKAKIAGFENKESIKTQNSQRNIMYLNWKVAAGFALLIGVSLWALFLKNKEPQLFASYYQPMPNLVDPITKGEMNAYTAFQLYELKQYENAAIEFDKLEPSSDIYFYEGLCHLNTNDVPKAIDLLNKALKFDEAKLRLNIEWYLLLAHIKNNDTENALRIANTIVANEEHPYLDKCKEIISRLKS